MTRAHFVQKARKENPKYGIAKGDSYYWWAFRHGGKRFSKTRPRPSQLTQSDYLSTAYGLQERIEDLTIDPSDLGEIASELRAVADDLRTLGSEQEEKIGNMPDSLQSSQTADLLQGRAEACESVADELESAADEIEALDPVEEEDPDSDEPIYEDEGDPTLELVGQVEGIVSGLGWNFEP